MEVQDVPAIAAAAHARGVPVALDNTYAAGVLFDAFAHGVDVSMQALTKYVGGHSDLLLGSVSVARRGATSASAATHRLLGMAVSPDDCALALRGLQTLGVRLERLEASALEVARWLAEQPEIERCFTRPSRPAPGTRVAARLHRLGERVLGAVQAGGMRRASSVRRAAAPVQARLQLGRPHSLVMAYPKLTGAQRGYEGRIVRLNVGLEEPADLIADLRHSLSQIS